MSFNFTALGKTLQESVAKETKNVETSFADIGKAIGGAVSNRVKSKEADFDKLLEGKTNEEIAFLSTKMISEATAKGTEGFAPAHDSPHVVLKPATCSSPEERAYYDQKTRYNCYGPFEEMHCPFGWEEFGATYKGDHGCDPIAWLPKCRKSLWYRKPKWQCCLENDGSDVDCPPGFCKAKATEQSCFEVLSDHCLQNTDQLAKGECRTWARRDGVRSRPDVFDAVKKHCAQKKYEKDAFCACVNANREDLCESDDCFARKHTAMKDLALCAAPQCKNPSASTWYPSEELANCVDICAPLLEIKDSELTGEEIQLLFQCGERFSAEERERFIEPVRQKQQAEEQQEPVEEKKKETEIDEKTVVEKIKEWPSFVWAIVVVAILVLVALVVVAARKNKSNLKSPRPAYWQ